jgi:hypothetical protein
MNPLRISVALCTYNGALFLEEQLESIASQVRLPDELVVLDDHSTDDTCRILRGFAEKAPFPVRISVNSDNIGSTKNFERAVLACQGDVIALSDQDDVWVSEKLSVIEDVFASSPEVGLVFSDGEVVDESLQPLGYSLWDCFRFKPRLQRRLRRGGAIDVLLKHTVVTGATMAFRSKHIPLVVPIPESVVHDWWIALLVSCVADIAGIPKPLIRYRQHTWNQLGAARQGLWEGVHTSLRLGPEVYLSTADRYRVALDRVRMLPVGTNACCIRLLEGKIAHFRMRGEMPAQLFLRLSAALKELILGRYHRYSLGFASFAKDVLSVG